MTRIRGALFDKDGTLIDFTATWRGLVDGMIDDYAAGDVELMDALGRAIGYDRRTGLFLPGSPVVAGSAAEVAALMAQLLPGRDAALIEGDANRRAAASGAGGASGLSAVAGLAETLDELGAAGVALGVATHDSEAAARAHVHALGVADRFGFVAGYDSGFGLKPGPGMPAAFCAALGLAPDRVVVIGDSVHDLGAARAAGCAAAVGVLTGPATVAELGPHADIVLASIADLPAFLADRFPA